VRNSEIIEIRDRLVALNSELQGGAVFARSFYLEDDAVFEGPVVHIIFVTTESEVDDSLETLDKFCRKANDQLGDSVSYIYCIYRTESDYQADFENDNWNTVLRLVHEQAA